MGTERNAWSNARPNAVPSRYIALEHHPNDSRLRIAEDGICQTLSQRMGTGGGNVPLVLEIYEDIYREEVL